MSLPSPCLLRFASSEWQQNLQVSLGASFSF